MNIMLIKNIIIKLVIVVMVALMPTMVLSQQRADARVTQKKVEYGKEPKEFHLYEEFEEGSVYFTTGDALIEILMKYDLMNDKIHLKNGNTIFLHDSKVKKFMIKGSTYHSYTSYSSDLQIDGFFQTLAKGKKYDLLRQTNVYVKKPDYNEALAIGNKNYEVKLSYSYYYTIGDRLFKLPKKTKNFSDLIDKIVVKDFLKKNSLKLNREKDIVSLFGFLNQS